MEKYQIIKKLGSGSFGHVQKARNMETDQIVAIKKLKKKYGTWEECLQLSQVKALRKFNHQNIIKLKQVVRVVNQAFFVFEFIDKDLYKLITERKEKGQRLTDFEIRTLSKQIILALQYIHKQGFFHRDIKPQNVLISNQFVAKIIDFGIAKEIRSKPPFTEYISTRWYRAPEILLKFSSYSIPVDIFALGCLIAEMYLMKPLFMGNSEIDQISKICSVLGSPTNQNWPQGLKQANLKGINFPQYSQISLNSVIPNCPNDALDFIYECLKWDPSKRISTNQMLSHPFITNEISYSPQKKYDSPYKKQHFTKYQLSKGKSQNYYKQFEEQDQFDQILNSYEKQKKIQINNNLEKYNKNINNKQDDQEWF